MSNVFFWNMVKKEIETQNTSQEWVAHKAQLNFGTMKQQIHHKRVPDAETAYKIAVALETTVEYLVTGVPPAGLSIEAMEIAQIFNNLSPEGQKAAQSMMEGLLKDYPQQSIQAESPAG
jgi:hypothetical protein